jgi:hypothetical protein
LYINFETGKSDIKAESKPVVEQIVALMKANPSLKISIEGILTMWGQLHPIKRFLMYGQNR